MTDSTQDIGLDTGHNDIDALIEEVKPKAVLIDNISTFIRTGNENEADVRLAFLAPDIQRAILDECQPGTQTLGVLMKGDIPLLWTEQRRRFGIEVAS
ncbi:MAG: hypothetical protein COB93_01530 [Sneathiella sp.]|nr:MAG: hypothetical protein COB93_01530 [Sneathiella sp.]